MYKINDYIVYKRNVCKITDIVEYGKRGKYYIFIPIDDNSLTIKLPIDNKDIRSIISKEEVMRIISTMKKADIIEVLNKKILEYQYKDLIMDGTFESLIRIIKTTYSRNMQREHDNKKKSDMDEYYFNEAERILYNEFSIALNVSTEEAKKIVIDELNKIEE